MSFPIACRSHQPRAGGPGGPHHLGGPQAVPHYVTFASSDNRVRRMSEGPTFNYPLSLGVSMRCTHCDRCCRETEMELCEADIARLERAGYRRDDFSRTGPDGVRRLRNENDYCFFYDREAKRCREYPRRPLGCVIYPVNMSVDGEIVVDDLCPEGNTVAERERAIRGERLRKLLETISSEAESSQRPS